MVRRCPECGADMIDLDPAAEMGSAPTRYECPECELRFERDVSGLFTEVED
jgi:predicted RNA-binding Zn-ribbon protein involved in translation (DUF1610 family)